MPKDRSSIEEMRRRLYERGGEKLINKKSRSLRPIEYDTKSKWTNQEREIIKPRKKHRPSLFALLIASLIFFLAAVAISALFIFGGSNIVSSQNIDIEIQGPATISGGEELSLQIAVTNRNNVPIKLADLLIEYPAGTRSATNIATALPRYREEIGMIAPGEITQRTVKAVLLGSENTKQFIKITVEYRIDGSNAILFAEKTYDIMLVSAPLSLSVSNINEVTSGQEVEFDITIASNSNTIIKNTLLSAEYPFGFEFISATPKPLFANNVWDIGDVQPEGERTVKLRGKIIGENEEERVFRFFSGIQDEKDEKNLGVTFITSTKSIIVKKSFIGIDLALNGDKSPEYISALGNEIRADISWVNNMPVRVADVEIKIKIEGAPLDKFSIFADQGFYNSSDNTILYSAETNSALASLDPGESGMAKFSFSSLGQSSGNIFKNPKIVFNVSVKGKRVSENNVPQEINSSVIKTIKLASDLSLTSRSVFFTGPFANTGPIPPKVENETTYTIIWTINNSSNIVDNVSVTATIPSYVRWTGKTNPSNEKISFNPLGGQIIWDVGSIKPKVDSGSGQREVAFQVALLPSVSHAGDMPALVNEQTIRGFDRFTETEIGGIKRALTTRLLTDPNFTLEEAQVIR